MSDLANYFLATEKRRAAYNQYNHASVALELAHIKERLAQIKSQTEPLSSLMDEPLSERDRLYASAFFVVVGRMPEVVK